MAIAKLGSIFSEVSGSIGGLITQISKAGQTLRTKSGKINRLNTFTQTPRIYIGFLAQSWAGLTAAQRNNWNSFALFAQQSMHRNKSMFLNGMQLFYQINHYRLMYSKTIISDPVFDATLPLPFSISLTAIFPDFKFIPGRAITNTTEICYLWMTPPLRAGIGNFENKLRLMLVNTGYASYISCATEYIRLFGAFPLTGYHIGVKATFANLNTGLMLPFQRAIITL